MNLLATWRRNLQKGLRLSRGERAGNKGTKTALGLGCHPEIYFLSTHAGRLGPTRARAIKGQVTTRTSSRMQVSRGVWRVGAGRMG